MSFRRIRFAATSKEGDETIVTFFIVVLVLLVTLPTFILAPRSKDRLIRLVPRYAVVYAHAQGDAISRLAPLLPASLAGVNPDEMAVFAVEQADGSGLSWAYLMRWDGGSADEMSNKYTELTDLPRMDGDKVFVAGDSITQTAMRLAQITGSLADEPGVSSGLRRIRNFTLNQMYITPIGAQALFGVYDIRPDDAQFLIWRNNNRLVFSSAENITPDVAQLALAGQSEHLYQGPEWSVFSMEGQTNESGELLANSMLGRGWSESDPLSVVAGRKLSSILGQADYFTLSKQDIGGSKYLIHVKNIEVREVKSVILDYFATRKPITRKIVMPDGDALIEMAVDSSWLDFSPKRDGIVVLASSEKRISVPTVTISEDIDGQGFWVADSPDRLSNNIGKDVGISKKRKFCFRNDQDYPEFWQRNQWLNGEELCAEEAVDKSVVIYSNH